MTMRLSTDAAHLARVWNHPRVRGSVSFGLTELLTEQNAAQLLAAGALYLANDYGGFLLIPNADLSVYDLHTQFTPEGWGRYADDAAWAQRYMFTRTPCVAISTFVPLDNRIAYRAALRFGFIDVGGTTELNVSGRSLLLTVKRWVVNVLSAEVH